LALGPFGLWLDPEGLLEGTTTFSVNGMSLRRLDDTNSLIHASIHAALGGQVPRLMPLRDVLQIAWSGRVDWDLMEERTRGWRLTAPVSHALRTASRRLHVDLPTETEPSLKAPVGWMERRVLEGYTTDRRTRGGMSVAALWAIPSLSGKAAYVRALLFPDRRFLEARAGAGSSSIGSRVMIPIGWALERMRMRLGRSGAARRRSTRTGSDLSSEKRDA
jgi:hypothetical protein